MKTINCNKILVMTAVSAEQDAVIRGLQGDIRFDVRVAGVGPIAAAIGTTTVLARATEPYDIVISAGIAGGFVGQAELGSIVIADEIVAADLGAETPDGFMSLDELGFGDSTRIQIDEHVTATLLKAMKQADLPARTGSILTLSTVTGTAATTEELAQRFKEAAAEAMEGYGIASAAEQFGIPALEVRTISNAVGPRDRAAWRIGDALKSLESAFAIMKEVL
ncbi:futalosine hydrolase [Paenibacillus sp. N1-5-1-14]|uniref:futalosine hydrolase n=1 Tax=Paenibacillus radicibacter TaxID=2972488 RepID=UPI00215993FD|nr:futalosine hydrolase [Paenibacillus radicibacter]MCR8644657.1 futalosine hydrolase [Paenibacillus radicibacter]